MIQRPVISLPASKRETFILCPLTILQRNMGYRILIADDRLWKKNCAEIPKEELRKILLKIRDLEKDPWPENIKVKHLKDYPVAAFRLRVGNYRVLFNK